MTIPEGWQRLDRRIAREFTFASFAQAIGFITEVALFCERTDHHPEWRNVYRTVSVELTTHDAGDVTGKDVNLAAHMNAVFASRR